jgi:alkylated DNA repair dioxygenase AlkB
VASVEPLQGTLAGHVDPAVATDPAIERVRLDAGSWVDVSRGWLRGADALLAHLVETVEWSQGRRWMYDHMVDDPRLSSWIRKTDPNPHPVFLEIRRALTHHYRVQFDGIGLNYYRDGRDSVAFHSDREMRYLDETVIAIVTLGAARPFLVKAMGRRDEPKPSTDIHPASGDLLVMGGACQKAWQHAVPKVAHAGPRISVTLRWTSGRGRNLRGPGARAPRRYDR